MPDDKTNPTTIPNRPSRLLTRQEAADLLVISVRTLDRLTKVGRIACRRIGRSVRYRLSDLRPWLG